MMRQSFDPKDFLHPLIDNLHAVPLLLLAALKVGESKQLNPLPHCMQQILVCLLTIPIRKFYQNNFCSPNSSMIFFTLVKHS